MESFNAALACDVYAGDCLTAMFPTAAAVIFSSAIKVFLI